MASTQFAEMLETFNLTKEGENLYKGKNLFIGSHSVYGGQVLAQAVSAANTSIFDDKILHSLHSYFIRPGDNDEDILYKVEIVKDGRSFNTRRVTASQKGKDICILSISYHKPESGIEHQSTMPNVARPESLASFSDIFTEFAEKFDIKPRGVFAPDGPFIIHPVEHYDPFTPKARPALNHTWFKSNGKMPDNPLVHQVALAYASDFNLLVTALFPHHLSFLTTPMQIASLDHAMWFHRPVKIDEWLLYVVKSPSASGARAFCTGQIFSSDGTLVASTAQEGLIRKL